MPSIRLVITTHHISNIKITIILAYTVITGSHHVNVRNVWDKQVETTSIINVYKIFTVNHTLVDLGMCITSI